MLKKEFKNKDVNRARNLITGNINASSETQIGYKKKIKEYKEGDIWTENNKTWTIKNGLKRTISRLKSIKDEVFMPLCCPKCNKVMKSHLDKPNYRIHKKCVNCVVDFESKLKYTPGKYEKYIKELSIKNKLSSLEEIESYLLDIANTSNSQYVSERGEVENWKGGLDIDKTTEEIKKSVKIFKDGIEEYRNNNKT